MSRRCNRHGCETTGDACGVRFWLRAALATLLAANVLALFFCLAPPWGSRQDLLRLREQLRSQLRAIRSNDNRLRNVAAKVQLGSAQSHAFEGRYFLPKRAAYEALMAEVQRLASVSGLQQRDEVNTEDPIEGSADLSLLNMTVNFEGSYDNLMRFLYQTDKSPLLLMLDTLQVSPEQRAEQTPASSEISGKEAGAKDRHGNPVSASVRFQAIIREEGDTGLGGRP